MTVDGKTSFHDGQTGWVTDKTHWIPSTTGSMNGVSPWPPVDMAKTFIVGAQDWPVFRVQPPPRAFSNRRGDRQRGLRVAARNRL